MKSMLYSVLLIAAAMICLAQTHVANPPCDRFITGPLPPSIHWVPPSMQLVPAGDYEMGDHSGVGQYDEIPVHPVYIDEFYMDTYEITVLEYCHFLNSAYKQKLIEVVNGVVYKMNDTEAYTETNSSSIISRIFFVGHYFFAAVSNVDHPMLGVSWYGAVAYTNWRSEQLGLTPCYDLETWECTYGVGGYRLPTEAEWEKAARGGKYTPYFDYHWGDRIDGSHANYSKSGDPYEASGSIHTTPVGYYDGNQIPAGVDMANGYGLYDMSGNVFEWTNNWYTVDYYQYCVDNGIYDNPKGPSTSPYDCRTCRGGAYNNDGIYARSSNRSGSLPEHLDRDPSRIGFRPILEN